jgi:UDP-N-acetylmuramoyl-tripeptide--D-alanyl-D-alanine ligase
MTEPLWTSEAIARATGGRLDGAGFSARGVSIDTRSLEPGDLFVALAGERDGHAFVGQALAKGAAGVLVTRADDGPAIVVPDTLAALEALGLAARKRAPRALRGAVTGSVGKTSVTQAVAAGLALAGPSHASIKSYNNHIGVPLTLARMPRETQRAVFEVGMNHAGEIEPLSRMIAPHAVAITTVGPVHIENFADGEAGVARAKAEIFAGLTPGGTAVLNADNAWFAPLRDAAERAGASIATFGAAPDCDAQLLDFTLTDRVARVSVRLHGQAFDFPIRQNGVHWGMNSLAVLLMLEALGVELKTALAALADFAPLEGRGAERDIAIPGGAFLLIDDSYNANPISMAAALRTLGARPARGRRIVALTDMLELGPDAADHHAGIALEAEAAAVDLVFCAGPLMHALWDALPPTRRGGYAPSADRLAPQVVDAVAPGDVVLVKGSNGSRASLIAAALAGLAPGAAEGKAG